MSDFKLLVTGRKGRMGQAVIDAAEEKRRVVEFIADVRAEFPDIEQDTAIVDSFGKLTVFEIAPERKGCAAAIIRTWLIGGR